MSEIPDRTYLDLKGARERLCRVQSHIRSVAHRSLLGEAIENVNRVGVFLCPQWSRFDDPELTDE
jgi:hypothetical protein